MSDSYSGELTETGEITDDDLDNCFIGGLDIILYHIKAKYTGYWKIRGRIRGM